MRCSAVAVLALGFGLLASCHEYDLTQSKGAEASQAVDTAGPTVDTTPTDSQVVTSSDTLTTTEPTEPTDTSPATSTTDSGCIPTEETCDGRDNDCDGVIDNDLWQTCVDCVGDEGVEVPCVDGAWAACPVPRELPPQVLVFPATTEECRWGEDGNLSPAGADYQAREEQRVTLEVPDEATLCTLQIQSVEEGLHYDDHLILTFNEIMLISSTRVDAVMEPLDSFVRYDWANLAGVAGGDIVDERYCAPETATCELPESDVVGNVDLSFTRLGNHRLLQAAKRIGEGAYAFDLVITGDNDDTDCQHSGLTIEVRVTYETP